jgi:hypothetical protein
VVLVIRAVVFGLPLLALFDAIVRGGVATGWHP